jgi:hypothetical protein
MMNWGNSIAKRITPEIEYQDRYIEYLAEIIRNLAN